MAKVKKKKSDFSFFGAIFTVVLFAIILVSTIYPDLQQVFNNNKETKELKVYYDKLLEEETSLNSEVVKLQFPEYKARRVREDLLYTKDGELILKILEDGDKKKDE